jgi:hypothetical protein
MEKTGVREHVTFGGLLRPDAKGFRASAMAKMRPVTGVTPGR